MVMVKTGHRLKIVAMALCGVVLALEVCVTYFSYFGRVSTRSIVLFSAALGLVIDVILTMLGFRVSRMVLRSVQTVEASVMEPKSISPSSVVSAVDGSKRNPNAAPTASHTSYNLNGGNIAPSPSSSKPNAAHALLLKINAKCTLGSRVLLAISITIPIQIILLVVIGGMDSIVYSSPGMLAFVFVGLQITGAVISFMELLLIAVTIEPISSKNI